MVAMHKPGLEIPGFPWAFQLGFKAVPEKNLDISLGVLHHSYEEL